ncbi:hypothetical protein BDK92_5297 [Micromonospora pisi]|uniref:DUF3558 domain-containing protein n=1 Tax=Micromonospora pisi TaxID=589240 RepID=A0A495JPL9_9ACTN|nr:hypothetical protein [Micromonospora pisi]RKR90913.1 hypothetical protein BDK92_5297 [Micromonospora pisi]
MRGRLLLIGAGLLVLSGCGEPAATRSEPLPIPPVVKLPAAAAGGVCQVLDYSAIEKAVGTTFDVSAATSQGETSSCVLQAEQASLPDLALAMTPTSADASVFNDEAPDGGQSVKGLGKAAYRLIVAAGKDHGAGVEVCWLASDGQMISLRYTLPAGEGKPAAEAIAGKLVTLAKQIDAAER